MTENERLIQAIDGLRSQLAPSMGQGYTPFARQGRQVAGPIIVRTVAAGGTALFTAPPDCAWLEITAPAEVSWDGGVSFLSFPAGAIVPCADKATIRAGAGSAVQVRGWDLLAGLIRQMAGSLGGSAAGGWELLGTGTITAPGTTVVVAPRDLAPFRAARLTCHGVYTNGASGRFTLYMTETDVAGNVIQGLSTTGADLAVDTGTILTGNATTIAQLDCGDGYMDAAAANTTRTYARRGRRPPITGGATIVVGGTYDALLLRWAFWGCR